MEIPLKTRVRKARQAKNLSQPAAAVAAGISLSALRNIEQGITTDPRLSTIRSLEDALGASLHDAVSTTNGGSHGREASGTHESPTTESPQIQQAAGLR